MKNKVIIFFFTIFQLVILNAYADDQISFDVTEIEILDGGNRIIGKNRGTINTNNGINIEADQFEFDKIKKILSAQGNVEIEDKLNKYNFSAQKIIYFQKDELIEIKGKAEALVETNFNFQTEDIFIKRDQMIISSNIGATILDNINQTRYEMGKFEYSLNDKILKVQFLI